MTMVQTGWDVDVKALSGTTSHAFWAVRTVKQGGWVQSQNPCEQAASKQLILSFNFFTCLERMSTCLL